eukprot:6190415-Pleurochrysis_carterae.AAC.2
MLAQEFKSHSGFMDELMKQMVESPLVLSESRIEEALCKLDPPDMRTDQVLFAKEKDNFFEEPVQQPLPPTLPPLLLESFLTVHAPVSRTSMFSVVQAQRAAPLLRQSLQELRLRDAKSRAGVELDVLGAAEAWRVALQRKKAELSARDGGDDGGGGGGGGADSFLLRLRVRLALWSVSAAIEEAQDDTGKLDDELPTLGVAEVLRGQVHREDYD